MESVKKRLHLRTWSIVVASSLVVIVPIPAHAAPQCFGKAPTRVGTDVRDEIKGTPGNDVIVSRGGNDQIFGRGGPRQDLHRVRPRHCSQRAGERPRRRSGGFRHPDW